MLTCDDATTAVACSVTAPCYLRTCPECGGSGYGEDGGQCERCYGEGDIP
jgi:hypothetical protein